jgi:scyllo-inositol 2-dehydrogenase (NADP+)
LLNYLVGRPVSVSGSVLNSIFSNDVDDEIYSTFQFSQGLYGQLATNWSDESFRKMSLKLSFWGSNGRINVDRQEMQVYIRSLPQGADPGLAAGWNVRYTTELTKPVWFYVRGEEYSAQIDHFVQCIRTGGIAASSFRSASDTSLVAMKMRTDAEKDRTLVALDGAQAEGGGESAERPPPKSLVRSLLDRMRTGQT